MLVFGMTFIPAVMRQLILLALPMIISQGAFALMIFTDRWFLAQLSPLNMAAAMGGGVAWYFTLALFNGILAYGNPLVAQYRGAQKMEDCSKALTQGLLLACGFLPLILLAAVPVRNFFMWAGHTPEEVMLEQNYYDVLIYAALFALFKTVFSSYFAGIGRSSVVMICEVFGVCCNIPLTWALVFGNLGLPSLGITGAAWATLLSSLCSLLLYLLAYLGKTHRKQFYVANSLRFDKKIMSRYIRLGTPSGFEQFLDITAFNFFLQLFHSYGVVAAASATIVFNWDILSFVPMLGLNIAIMSMTGEAVGARNLDEIKSVTQHGYLLGIIYSATLFAVFLTFRHELVELFIFEETYADGIRELASYMMLGLSCYVLLEGILQVASGVLRGAGDTRWCMSASVMLHWLMLGLQYYFIVVAGYGPKLSWWIFVGMILLIVMVFLWRLQSHAWRTTERLEQVML
jgi:MATE family multidrug resistance protein